MIPLSRTTDKLQAFLSGAAATTNPTVTVGFSILSAQIKEDNSEYPMDRQFTVLAGATETDICGAPAASGFTKHIKYINVYNADTAAVTVTICIDDNGTNRIQVVSTLETTESLCWTPAAGWHIVT